MAKYSVGTHVLVEGNPAKIVGMDGDSIWVRYDDEVYETVGFSDLKPRLAVGDVVMDDDSATTYMVLGLSGDYAWLGSKDIEPFTAKVKSLTVV